MAKKSAGILIYRKKNEVEVFLVHPGGPFWANKDKHSWSIPKGEFTGEEQALDAAKRELKEETGFEVEGEFHALAPVKQPGGKMIYAWYIEGDVDETKVVSNTIFIKWPPAVGKKIEIPEVDKGDWFDLVTAREKIFKGQVPLIDEFEEKIKA